MPVPARPPVRPRRKLSRRKKWIFGIVAALMALGAALVVLEIATRILTRANLVHFGEWETIPGVRFKLRPYISGNNSQGFHDIERPFQKPAGRRRVLFLGDSYTWGLVDYDHRFTTLVERELNRLDPSHPTEVINLGVASYGPADCFELWKNYGVRYQPDAVVFCFYQGNDVTDNSLLGYHRAVLGEKVPIRIGNWLDKSWFIDFLRVKARLAHFGFTRNTAVAHGMTSADIIAGWLYTVRLFDPARQADVQWSYDCLSYVFRDMKAFAAQQRTPLLVVQLPAAMQIDPDLARRVAKAAGRPIADFDFTLISRKIKSQLDHIGITSADISDAIKAEPDPAGLYIPTDTHWNERGNAAAAKAMTPAIAQFLGVIGQDI